MDNLIIRTALPVFILAKRLNYRYIESYERSGVWI